MDPLQRYQQKRKFAETPEPKGSKQETNKLPLHFVIHKHAASRLHYDLRLEAGGVLKSWAIPKGPSLNPLNKHLAIHVEDHPFEYKDFEGVIPKGNYGAGTVMIWDEGLYQPLGALASSPTRFFRDGLQRGHLVFMLAGKKLNGEFALIKLGHGSEKDWILVKARDQYVSNENILKQDQSARSGMTMEELKRFITLPSGIALIPRSQPPHPIKPMMATLVDQPFDSPGWLFEVKWDGYRAIAEIKNGTVRIYSRNGIDFSDKFSRVTDSLTGLPDGTVLDGEIVVTDEKGRSNFQLLQDYQLTGEGTLIYYVFDILYYAGHDLTHLSLTERRQVLREVAPKHKPPIQFSEDIRGQGKEFFNVAQKMGLEGIMAKRLDSNYQVGVRSHSWQKIKHHNQQEAIICGFTKPRGSRLNFGALLLGVYVDTKLTYVGDVGTGFDDNLLKIIMQKMQPLITGESPFTFFDHQTKNITWLQPELVCEIKFQEWTKDGRMRQPVFLGLREDKSPKDVHQELPQTKKFDTDTSDPFNFVHPNKIFWPEQGITKGDLLAYYEQVSKHLFPHLRDRPITLHRFPNGINGNHFYQKNIDSPPPWMKVYKDRSETENRVIKYVICNDKQTLKYLVNLGCIDLNVWSSTRQHPSHPDFMVFDLDPVGIGFQNVLRTGMIVKQILDHVGIPSFAKTSGKRGLHIYVPIGTRYSFAQVRDLAHLIAIKVHDELPQITSLERMPGKRQGMIYLDYLQNRKGATMAAPYSVRPVPAATVSTPVTWAEVEIGFRPTDFTMDKVIERLKRLGDIFTPVLGGGFDLENVLNKLSS